MAEVRLPSPCHDQSFCHVSTKSPAAESNGPRKERFMERAIQPPAQVLSRVEVAQNESGLFSSESELKLQKLIFSGYPSRRGSSSIAQRRLVFLALVQTWDP